MSVDTLSGIKSAVSLLSTGGRKKACSLSELGEHLRAGGFLLPAGESLSDFIASHGESLVLSGPPSSRKVSLVNDTTEQALVQRVRGVLLEQPGPITTSELKLRLRASGGFVPGLVSLLRTHDSVFRVEGGVVQLADADVGALEVDRVAASVRTAAMPVRLHSLGLPSAITTASGGDEAGAGVDAPMALPALASVREVILLDLDNRALLAFEAAARRALAATAEESVLVLAFCSTHHNPRLPRPTADALVSLASRGRLRVLTPLRDRPNAADFVLTFWVGWLHACTHPDCRFVLVSEDVSLDQTVCDLLKGQGRAVATLEGLGVGVGAVDAELAT